MRKIQWMIALVGLLWLFGCASLPTQTIEFEGETYRSVWYAEENNAELTEFVRDGESVHSWTKMITVQNHPQAGKVSDVIKPYMAARQPFFVGPVQTYKKSEGPHTENVFFELVLSDRIQPYFEYVLVRAFSDPQAPVVLFVFSQRIKHKNVSETMKRIRQAQTQREKWFHELLTLSVRTVQDQR